MAIKNSDEARSMLHVLKARLDAESRDPATWATLASQARELAAFAKRMEKACTPFSKATSFAKATSR